MSTIGCLFTQGLFDEKHHICKNQNSFFVLIISKHLLFISLTQTLEKTTESEIPQKKFERLSGACE